MIGELSQQEIEEVLSESTIGRLACCSEEKVYVIPLGFVWDGARLIFQTTFGKKIEMMRNNPNVCFQTDKIIGLSEWKSVVVSGTFAELTNEEKPAAGRLLIDKLSQELVRGGRSPRDVTPEKFAAPGRTVFFAIIPDNLTGRFECPD